MGTHCLTEVTSKNIMKFLALAIVFLLVFAPFWPCLIQCPIHTHMPCLMNPGMLHLRMVEPSVESRFKHTVGPSKDAGYDSFAPWGFYVTQPKDDFGAHAYHYMNNKQHCSIRTVYKSVALSQIP